MPNSIHHLNFIVRDLEAALPVWERLLGRAVDRRDELPARGIIAARFRLGDVWLVLVQPTQADSVPGQYLERHGEGFFLLSLGVDSLAGELARLGDGAFSGPIRRGADGWQVRDLQPAPVAGIQLQFTEELPAARKEQAADGPLRS